MADLDTLRPEVQAAMEVIAGEAVCTCHEDYTSRGMKDPACNHDLQEYVDTLCTELVRLATIEVDALIALDCEHDWQVEHERAEKAEAELAALKAGIAGAAHVEVTLGCAIDGEIPPDLALCKVALVKVEE